MQRAAVVTRQARRIGAGTGAVYDDLENVNLRRQVIGLYKDCIEAIPHAKVNYAMPAPMPVMQKRIRMAFEMNRNVKDPQVIIGLIADARLDLANTISQMFTSPVYLRMKYFSTATESMLSSAALAYQNREMLLGKKTARQKARAIALGTEEFTALPGPIVDEHGHTTGYFHPKGALPPGESELFARPPAYKDWGEFSLPDPWNPVNNPEGPPDPHLIQNVGMQIRVDQARTGPYARHRIRRLIEHEKKTRDMSQAEYLEYFRQNEVHYAANEFELPEYEWAEAQMDKKIRRCKNENQAIFEPVRAEWVAKYKGVYKSVNYAPAVDYWLMAFKQWVPNYDRRVVEAADTIGETWREFVSHPANYAAYRSQAFEQAKAASPLAKNFGDFVAEATSPADAKRPYDHPQFENKWWTDNELEQLLIYKEDAEDGLGCPHAKLSVLDAETQILKDQVGCVELTEQHFKGEWWNRGHIKLMSTLARIHDVELCTAILQAAGVQETASLKDAQAAIAKKDWSSFSFTEYSYLRYPDDDKRGVHSWRTGEDEAEAELMLQLKWRNAFLSLFNYEQTVPVWMQGCSRRMLLNKSAEQGGWSLKSDATPFWDKLVSI